jgi:spermidine synthase
VAVLQVECLLLDAYDGDGMVPAALQKRSFLRDCKAVVADGGVVTVRARVRGGDGELECAMRAGCCQFVQRYSGI